MSLAKPLQTKSTTLEIIGNLFKDPSVYGQQIFAVECKQKTGETLMDVSPAIQPHGIILMFL